jgi:hypothetical protein
MGGARLPRQSGGMFNRKRTIMTTTTTWIPVGALGDAFAPDNHCLPPDTSLDGRTLQLHGEDGSRTTLAFAAGAVTRDGVATAQCSITRPRPGIWFVDVRMADTPRGGTSLVLDLERGCYIEIDGTLPTREEAHVPLLERVAAGTELTPVKARIVRGTIDRPFAPDAALPRPTGELLGKRVEYIYSPHERYEHIYLNDGYYTWRCIEGFERGLCDTDACHYYAIDTDLVLFIWREKIVPTLGIVMVDLRAMKTTGKIMGYEGHDFASVRNFGVGAHARVLSAIPAE